MGLLKQTVLTGAILGLAACGGGDESGGGSAARTGYIGAIEEFIPRLLVGSSVSIEENLTVHLEFQDEAGNTTYAETVKINEIENHWNNDSPAASNPVNVSFNATSSDSNVIAIENGNMVAKQPGKATVSYTVNMSPINTMETTTGEIIVCPFTDVSLRFGGGSSEFKFPSTSAPIELSAINSNNPESLVFVAANPIIDASQLAQHGLTIWDCPTEFVIGTIESDTTSKYFQAKTRLNGGSTTQGYPDLFSEKEVDSQTANFFGINFPNITLTRVNTLENPRMTQAGFDGNWVLNTINPVTVMAFSPELQRDVDVSHYYLARSASNTGVLGTPVCSGGFCGGYGETVDHSVEANQTSAAFYFQGNELLEDFTGAEMPVIKGINKQSLNTTSGVLGTVIKVKSELLANDKTYDISNLFYEPYSWLGSEDEQTHKFVNLLVTEHPDSTRTLLSGPLGSSNSETVKIIFGEATDVAYRGRWVQLDTGEEHWILPHSSVVYTKIDDNHLSYSGNDGKTKHLLRTGVDAVALNGSVNLIEEASVAVRSVSSGIQSRSLVQARGLGGIASIDMILSNINTGEETTVTVDDGGNFTETVPTGDYKLQGTIEDNSILYNVDKKITVEKDVTYAGKLNLAKVDLYNFESNISGCEHDYKCYANKNYQFTITVKNTGLIDSSGVIAAIEDISVTNPLVTSFTLDNLEISGYAVGDSKTYTFNMTFAQPDEDTVIEVPFSITDIASRTWNDTLYIPLSKYDPMTINVIGTRANVIIEGRTALPINGSVTVPKKFGSTYELVVSNEGFSSEAVYGIGVDTSIVQDDLNNFTGLLLNEPTDNVVEGATELSLNDKHVSYISQGDVDFYELVITDPSL